MNAPVGINAILDREHSMCEEHEYFLCYTYCLSTSAIIIILNNILFLLIREDMTWHMNHTFVIRPHKLNVLFLIL